MVNDLYKVMQLSGRTRVIFMPNHHVLCLCDAIEIECPWGPRTA